MTVMATGTSKSLIGRYMSCFLVLKRNLDPTGALWNYYQRKKYHFETDMCILVISLSPEYFGGKLGCFIYFAFFL